MPLRWIRLITLCLVIIGEIVSWYYVFEDNVTISGHLGGFFGGLLGGPALLLDAMIVPDLFAKSYYNVIKNYRKFNVQKNNENNENNKEKRERKEKEERPRSLKNTILFVSACVLYPLYTIAGIINYFTLDNFIYYFFQFIYFNI